MDRRTDDAYVRGLTHQLDAAGAIMHLVEGSLSSLSYPDVSQATVVAYGVALHDLEYFLTKLQQVRLVPIHAQRSPGSVEV